MVAKAFDTEDFAAGIGGLARPPDQGSLRQAARDKASADSGMGRMTEQAPSCEFCNSTNVIPYDDLRLCLRVGDAAVSSWGDRKLLDKQQSDFTHP